MEVYLIEHYERVDLKHVKVAIENELGDTYATERLLEDCEEKMRIPPIP